MSLPNKNSTEHSETIGVQSIVKDYFGEFVDPISIAYALILNLIGYIFNAVNTMFVQKQNLRFKKDQNDILAN